MDTVFEAVLAFKTECENRCPETCERLSYAYRKFITEKFGYTYTRRDEIQEVGSTIDQFTTITS